MGTLHEYFVLFSCKVKGKVGVRAVSSRARLCTNIDQRTRFSASRYASLTQAQTPTRMQLHVQRRTKTYGLAQKHVHKRKKGRKVR